jgi:hypothetical protein
MRIPLITYTERYNEIEDVTIEYAKKDLWGDPLASFLMDKKYLKVTSKGNATWTAYFMINDSKFNEDLLKDFYFVFGAFVYPVWGKGGQIYLLDNRGNLYTMEGGFAPVGPRPQGFGMPFNTSPYLTYFSTILGDLSKPILPDTFIDLRVKESQQTVNNVLNQQQSQGRTVMYYSVKPMKMIKPHQAFQPTVELAEYIELLEKESNKNTVNINTQTNNIGKMNMNSQTNWNTKQKNRNGFVKTLRNKCNKKKCNVENTRRRHSMVNSLRQTVKNSQNKVNLD